MKTVKIIFLIVLAIVVVLLAIAYMLPRKITVERSALIPAPDEIVFNQVNVLKNWENWSPWHQIDPDMQITYEGPELGTGASYSWLSADPSAGKGKLTITESIPFSLITVEIDFMERGTALTEYTFQESGTNTLMTWTMHTDLGNNPVARYFGLFFDKMLGNDFEKGMRQIKEVVASPSANSSE